MVLKQVDKVSVSVSEVEPNNEGASQGETASGESEKAPPRVSVRITLDVSAVRSVHSAWLAGGAASGAAVLGTTGILVGLDPVALAALPVAGGLTAGGHYVGRWSAQNVIEQIHTGVAGLLDRLEHPERDRPDGRSRSQVGRLTTRAKRGHMRGER